ncbi:MAG: hypothetical protein HY855_10065 [Burkholderiales bacterium]|nr:hypothetical protein [Burkholderiales bacterium]
MTNSSPLHRPMLRSLALACTLALGAAQAGTVTYTLDADFDLGTLLNLNHNAPNSNQLQLNVIGSGFPLLWIANAGEHTLSKFDTTQIGASPGREVARYYTWFSNQGPTNYAWSGPAPSRTAMDIDGNAYVLNRHFDGRSAVLIKILANGFIDRNGNGVVDTSFDADSNGSIQSSEMKSMIDLNGNGVIDCPQSAPYTGCEIGDERVAWAVRVPDGVGAPLRNGRLGRALCMGKDGHLWVGLFNDGAYYKVSSVDGHTLAGPVGVPNVTPYGCLIDQNGTLWSAGLGSYLGKITGTDTAGPYSASSYYHGNYGSNYGIALGKAAGDGHTMVYLGGTGYSYLQFDSATNTFSVPASMYTSTYATNVDGSGNILVSKVNGGIAKFNANGGLIYDKPPQANTATDSRGVMPDANNDIWQVALGTSRVSKYEGVAGGALGVLNTGNSPYTYSDASGFAAANITVQTGTWTVVQDGGAAGTPWGTVSWNASLPAGASVSVKVRTADTVPALQGQSFADVSNGVAFSAFGKYLEAQVRLTANSLGASPVLQDITIASVLQEKCDIDQDGDVDINDINAILAARNKTVPPANPALDIDGNGVINVNDSRGCVLKCTRPKCAP